MNRVFLGGRVFLGWQHPALHSVVQYLWDHYCRPVPQHGSTQHGSTERGSTERGSVGGIWQLSDVIVVVPGGRAGRRLGQLLAERAAKSGVVYFPPDVTTAGQLPERLYLAKRPFASQLVQQLAWAKALQTTNQATLRHFLSDIPASDDSGRWFELATLLWRQHRILAADGLNFERVATEGAAVPGFAETRRWQALANVQARYLRLLDGMHLWDRQTARLFALTHAECATKRALVLVGMVDINLALRTMLQQVERHVTSLVFADDSWAEKFDELGCVRPSAWRSAQLPIDDEQLHQVDGPADQAARVISLLADLPDKYTASQVTVGVPNENLVPSILRRLQQVAVPARYGPGESIEASRPIRLMRAVADYVLDRRVTTLIELLRHPDVVRRFRDMFFDDDVDRLDQVYREHLPIATTDLVRPELVKPRTHREPANNKPANNKPANNKSANQRDDPASTVFHGSPAARSRGDVDRQPTWIQSVTRLVETVEQWLAPLTDLGTANVHVMQADAAKRASATRDARRQPAAWGDGILEVLQTIYGGTTLNPDDPAERRTLKGCQELRRGIAELQDIPKRVAPRVTASEAILMSLEATAGQQVAPPANPDAIELLGWLELPLDDAPVCIVTQLNEGSVPTSATNDLFLPDSLRTHLGLDDNQRRYARDAYAITALAKSREWLHLIFGRRDELGNPLLPSRLLFSANQPTITARCLRFFGEPTENADLPSDVGLLVDRDPATSPGTTQRFVVPRPRIEVSFATPRATTRVDAAHHETRAGASRVTETQTGANQTGATQTGATQTGATQTGATQTGATQTGATQTGATADCAFQAATQADERALPLTLNVTDFKRYLDCPYRFYLTKIERLHEVTPEPEELDGAAFGNRLHDVLEKFGKSEVRDLQEVAKIEDFLLATLHSLFRDHYGSRPRAVLQLQRAQMELRLKSFAEQQVAWRRQGWRILLAESDGKVVPWALADNERQVTPIGLRGRIDRVDCHELDGRFAMLDYKSSDAGNTPRSVHHRGKSPLCTADWKDLQLPLYRHFANALSLGDPDQLVLGYVTLPRAANGCRFLTADWKPHELQLADQAAWDVVTRIRAGQFWPPAENPAYSSEALDRICQKSVFDRQLAKELADGPPVAIEPGRRSGLNVASEVIR